LGDRMVGLGLALACARYSPSSATMRRSMLHSLVIWIRG